MSEIEEKKQNTNLILSHHNIRKHTPFHTNNPTSEHDISPFLFQKKAGRKGKEDIQLEKELVHNEWGKEKDQGK